MRRLRVVKAIPFFAPATEFGGVVTQAVKVCEQLAARGHDVSVVTTDNGVTATIPRDTWIDRDGYRVYYARTKPWHRVVPYWSPTMGPALETALAGADVCAMNVGLTLANRLVLRIANKHGVPCIYNAEGALCPVRLGIKKLRKKLFLAKVERPLLRSVAACQVVTEKEASDLFAQGVSESRIHLVPNGIEPFRPGDGPGFRAQYGITNEDLVLLYLGRLHEVKGIEFLVDVFANAAPANAKLILAGHDEDGTGARLAGDRRIQGLGDRIHMVGHLDAEQRRDALSAADLFVLTSRSEGLPNAVLEALSAGVPCLLTEPCNVPEVGEADAGRVVPFSRDAATKALRSLLKNPDRLIAMGDRARTLAAERFELDRVITQLETLYREVIDAQPAATSLHPRPAHSSQPANHEAQT